MTKRQEDALKTKQKLLDVATDFIMKGDFNNIKVEDITKACGCAKGTFYVYFKNHWFIPWFHSCLVPCYQTRREPRNVATYNV